MSADIAAIQWEKCSVKNADFYRISRAGGAWYAKHLYWKPGYVNKNHINGNLAHIIAKVRDEQSLSRLLQQCDVIQMCYCTDALVRRVQSAQRKHCFDDTQLTPHILGVLYNTGATLNSKSSLLTHAIFRCDTLGFDLLSHQSAEVVDSVLTLSNGKYSDTLTALKGLL